MVDRNDSYGNESIKAADVAPMSGAAEYFAKKPDARPAAEMPPADAMAEEHYWRVAYADSPLYRSDYAYEHDYAAAYRVGYEGRYRHQGSYAEHEQDLAIEWERVKGGSRLTWEEAKAAMQEAWDRVQRQRSEQDLVKAEDRFQQEVMNGEWDARPVVGGIGVAGGVVTPAGGGAATDPIGMAVEAVVGNVMGGVANNTIVEAVTVGSDHDAYWRDHYRDHPGYRNDYTYEDDYAAAYRLGYEKRNFYKTTFEDNEAELKDEWEEVKGSSRLTWEEAKAAMREAWDRIEREMPVNTPAD